MGLEQGRRYAEAALEDEVRVDGQELDGVERVELELVQDLGRVAADEVEEPERDRIVCEGDKTIRQDVSREDDWEAAVFSVLVELLKRQDAAESARRPDVDP